MIVSEEVEQGKENSETRPVMEPRETCKWVAESNTKVGDKQEDQNKTSMEAPQDQKKMNKAGNGKKDGHTNDAKIRHEVQGEEDN